MGLAVMMVKFDLTLEDIVTLKQNQFRSDDKLSRATISSVSKSKILEMTELDHQIYRYFVERLIDEINEIGVEKIDDIVRELVLRQVAIQEACFEHKTFVNNIQYYQLLPEMEGNQTCIFHASNPGMHHDILRDIQVKQLERWHKSHERIKQFCSHSFRDKIHSRIAFT